MVDAGLNSVNDGKLLIIFSLTWANVLKVYHLKGGIITAIMNLRTAVGQHQKSKLQIVVLRIKRAYNCILSLGSK